MRAVLTAVAEQNRLAEAVAPPGARSASRAGRKRPATLRRRPKCPGDAARFKVERIVIAFECGAIVNPDGLDNQVEGSVVQGLGGALFEAIEFADGHMRNGSMEQYRVPRFKDVPVIETILLDRRDHAVGGRRRVFDDRRRPGDRLGRARRSGRSTRRCRSAWSKA